MVNDILKLHDNVNIYVYLYNYNIQGDFLVSAYLEFIKCTFSTILKNVSNIAVRWFLLV